MVASFKIFNFEGVCQVQLVLSFNKTSSRVILKIFPGRHLPWVPFCQINLQVLALFRTIHMHGCLCRSQKYPSIQSFYINAQMLLHRRHISKHNTEHAMKHAGSNCLRRSSCLWQWRKKLKWMTQRNKCSPFYTQSQSCSSHVEQDRREPLAILSFFHSPCVLFSSSHWRCSIKKAILKNFAIFIGKHLRWILFL